MSKNDGINSVIGKGSVFQGKFQVEGSIQVDGQFDGDLISEYQVIIGESGQVKTNGLLSSQKIIVAGTMLGSIKAEESVNLLESGKMVGDIETPYLNVEKGVVFEGNVKITGNYSGDLKKDLSSVFNGADKKLSKDIPKDYNILDSLSSAEEK